MDLRELLLRHDVQQAASAALAAHYRKYQVVWPDADRDTDIVLRAALDHLGDHEVIE